MLNYVFVAYTLCVNQSWTVEIYFLLRDAQSAVLRSHVICPSVHLSVTLVDQDLKGWKSWKLIARTISPTSLPFVAQRSPTYSQGNMEKFWAENVRSTATSKTSGWIESTESHVILGWGVAVCLLLSAHHAVIFAIAQLSCFVFFLYFTLNWQWLKLNNYLLPILAIFYMCWMVVMLTVIDCHNLVFLKTFIAHRLLFVQTDLCTV